MRTCAAWSRPTPSVPRSCSCATTWSPAATCSTRWPTPPARTWSNCSRGEELNVGDIASRVTLSRPTVSHHLLILKRAGLVRTRKQGREVYYRLNKAPIVNTLQGLVDSLTCC